MRRGVGGAGEGAQNALDSSATERLHVASTAAGGKQTDADESEKSPRSPNSLDMGAALTLFAQTPASLLLHALARGP